MDITTLDLQEILTKDSPPTKKERFPIQKINCPSNSSMSHNLLMSRKPMILNGI